MVHGIGSACDLKFRKVEEVGKFEQLHVNIERVIKINYNSRDKIDH